MRTQFSFRKVSIWGLTPIFMQINQMNPHDDYKDIAVNTIEYLNNILENFCGSYDLGFDLKEEEYKEIRNRKSCIF
mgnify:CR=1 FL=1